ncbi:hypothetical protein N7494_000647 [Penicillium frequentans]|uniref:DUF7703 domain-containing protein n=1 Tax=Penicillium frequentans TaxID=3151616 RepID=A0AAD6D6C0_9EURO|nr:hypothetical protein N7494_000647 [Penicillium glabrum]
MDTFMANLSLEVGVVLQENISNIIVISMLATAIYNALETVLITFDFVKNYRVLYFWSMQASCWGILVHAVSAIICCTFQQSTLPTSILFIVGWYAMVTGQAVVCYSRLRLVVLDTSRVRWVLRMIVVNACILYVPMTVLFFGRISGDSRFLRPAAIFNRIQLVGFCVQESVMSCVYMSEAMRNLICVARLRGREQPRATTHLFGIGGFVFLLNILLLLTEYRLHFIQISLQAVIYSIKLKLEFVLLYHLRTAMHADALGFPPGRIQARPSSSDLNCLTMNSSPTAVALEVIRPSRGEVMGDQDPCHSHSSSTADYHEALCEISHHPAGI